MKVLLSWLREFAPDIAGDPEDLAETLADLGLAVEELSTSDRASTASWWPRCWPPVPTPTPTASIWWT